MEAMTQIEFPFNTVTDDELVEHDWIPNPKWFQEQNARYSLCNVLLLDLSDIQEAIEIERIDCRARLISVFALGAGWARVTNQIYELAPYDYRELARRLQMSGASIRLQFNTGVEDRLWELGEGGVVRLLPKFLKLARVSKCARDILQDRGREYATSGDLFARNTELNTRSQNPASRVPIPDLNSVGVRELVLETPELPAIFVEEVSSSIKTTVKAHGFRGRINKVLLIRAAKALWSEGCRKIEHAGRYISTLIKAIALRDESDAYRAHTLALIVKDDAHLWRLVKKQNPVSRAQEYIKAQETSTRISMERNEEEIFEYQPPRPLNLDITETFEELEAKRQRDLERQRATRHKAEPDVFTGRGRPCELPEGAERPQVLAMIRKLSNPRDVEKTPSVNTSGPVRAVIEPTMSFEDLDIRSRVSTMLEEFNAKLDEAILTSARGPKRLTRPHLSGRFGGG